MKRKAALRLVAAVLAAVATGGSGAAMTTERRVYDNGFTIELNYYEADDWNLDGFPFETTKHFDFTDDMKRAIGDAVDYYGNLFAKGAKTTQPVQIFIRSVLGNGGAYAYAQPLSIYRTYQFTVDQITKGTPLASFDGFTMEFPSDIPMQIETLTFRRVLNDSDASSHYGFGTAPYTGVTGNNENDGLAISLVTTAIHEMGHAFGLNESNIYMASKIKDYYGNSYNRDKTVISPSAYREKTGLEPGLNDTYVILDALPYQDDDDYDTYFASPETYYLYFTGDHVAEVLDGASFLGKENAIPIIGIEYGNLDASHSMLSTMMGHRTWASYAVPIEADLAMLEDMGYVLDRRAYFGYSLYDSHRTKIVETGYSARNDAGTAYTGEYSDVSYGVGLHLYGSDNTVTQKGNILTKGRGAVGVLIAGVRNDVTVDTGTEIHADGAYGVGVQAAYGRNHILNLDGIITADGENGIGVKFDFGTGAFGYTYGAHGSYLKYIFYLNLNEGAIEGGYNQYPDPAGYHNYESEEDELLGPLAETVNIKGTISGASDAVYIEKSAFVKNINIYDGAKISGNITSDWKHYDSPLYRFGTTYKGWDYPKLCLFYHEKFYEYDKYIPDLVTNLNFKGNHTYDGNITGTDNMKMNISGGATHFGGTADVVNVTVAEDGELYGGTYIVNDMSEKMCEDFSDDTTGTLYNYGKFGTDREGKDTVVIGNLESASGSTLTSAANEETSGGTIKVYGKAKLAADVKAGGTQGEDGVVLQSYDILQIGGAEEISTSAMRIASGINENGIIVGKRVFGDNVGEKDELQQETFNAAEHIDSRYKNEEDLPEELQILENMTPAAAKTALTKIGSNEAAALYTGRVQQKNIVENRITSRMQDAWAKGTKNISQEHDLWVKTGKSWGDLDKATLGSSDIIFGYDRNIGENRIDGFFVSYSDENISENSDRAELYDTRIGYYSGRRKGPATGTFYADIGYVRGKTERNIGIGNRTAEGKPRTRIIEAGFAYKYDLKYGTNAAWHTSPYGKVRVSFARHKGYTETGAGVFSQDMHERNRFYGDAEIGVELRCREDRANFGFMLGLRQVFAGLDPEFTFNYVGEPGYTHTRAAYQDKTRLVIGADGNIALGKDWRLSGEARYEKGAHSRELSGAVSLEYRF